MSPEEQAVVDLLQSRGSAYRRVFNEESTDGQIVVGDLRKFCCADVTTHDESPFYSALLEGRRQVWLHIQACKGQGEEKQTAALTARGDG